MAIIDYAYYTVWAGKTFSVEEQASIEAIIIDADKAIKSKLQRTLEQATFTGLIRNAPPSHTIFFNRYAPITLSTLRVWRNPTANGNPAAFTSENELVMYTDYIPTLVDDDSTFCTGSLTYAKGPWGYLGRFKNNNLRDTQYILPGAIQATFTGGYTADNMPADLKYACCQLVSQMLGYRKYGHYIGSESWNGYSYNLPGVGLLTQGMLGNPDIEGMLNPYMNYVDMIS